MAEEGIDDPLGTEADEAKREGVPKEGPPVGQMATTYGSAFIGSEEEADAVASSGPDSQPVAERVGGGGNPGGENDPPADEP